LNPTAFFPGVAVSIPTSSLTRSFLAVRSPDAAAEDFQLAQYGQRCLAFSRSSIGTPRRKFGNLCTSANKISYPIWARVTETQVQVLSALIEARPCEARTALFTTSEAAACSWIAAIRTLPIFLSRGPHVPAQTPAPSSHPAHRCVFSSPLLS